MSNKTGAKGQGRPSSGSVSGGSGPKIHNVKLVLLGDTGVGKSSIALRFVRGEFLENSEATIGAAFLTQTISVSNQTIKFDIWDTAGQDRYHSLAPMYYRGAQAAVVVYDVTNIKSFNRAIDWIKELRQQVNSQIIIVFAGNKADMAAEKRAVSRDEAQAFAEENNLVFTEASAKTGMCVGDVFMAIAQTIARQGVSQSGGGGTGGGGERGLKIDQKDVKKKGPCC